MHYRPRSLFAATVVAASIAPLTAPDIGAQPAPSVRDGLSSHQRFGETGNPFGFSGFAQVPGGDLFVAVAHQVLRVDAQGNTRVIRSFGISTRIGLLALASPNALWYVHSDTDRLYRRDVGAGTETSQPIPRNTFDIETTAAGDILLSANPRFPQTGANNGIWLVDPSGGTAHREVITLTGPSGPLAIETRTGDLFYATQASNWPPPPNSTRLLRFEAAHLATAIAGGPPLTESDGTTVALLDGGYDLVFDDAGRLYASDAGQGDVRRIDAATGAIDPTPVVARNPGLATLQLQFVDGSGATFDPYQPVDGGVLQLATNDWNTTGAVHAVMAARPVLTATPSALDGPGTLRVDLTGLPGSRTAWLVASVLPLVPERPVLTLDGVPAWFAIDLSLPPVLVPTATDAAGTARVDIRYAGGLDLYLALQSAGTSPSPNGRQTIASSNATTVRIH